MLDHTVTVQVECERRKSAWASDKDSPDGPFFIISETKVDCEALRAALGGMPCKQVW